MKPAHRMPRWFAVFTALALTGCEANRYEIEMRPTGKTVQRQLTCWRERTANEKTTVVAFPADELGKIAAAYDAAVTGQKGKKHKFVGAFAGEMPNDLGGSGSYTHWNTPFGSVSAYIERIRGNDDLLADVERRQEATDRIADLLIGWLASELDGQAGFGQLREFLEDDFRRDLKNLSLYARMYEIVLDQEDAAQPECLVRVGQYLAERSYFKPGQLPMLARALREVEREEPAPLLALLQRFTASKMGIPEDQPVPPSLRFLSDATILQTSINDYLRQTEDFKRLLGEWQREKAINPEVTRPEPSAVLGDLIVPAFFPSFHLGRSDQLEVQLGATTEPFLTNGQWDEKGRQVRWSRSMPAAEPGLSAIPGLLYAFWSTPDKQEQKAHFGEVVLEGDALGNYCLWYLGLSTREAKEWNDFVASLSPSAGLVGQIRTFQFSHEPAPESGQEDSDLAAIPRELILRSLTDEATEK